MRLENGGKLESFRDNVLRRCVLVEMSGNIGQYCLACLYEGPGVSVTEQSGVSIKEVFGTKGLGLGLSSQNFLGQLLGLFKHKEVERRHVGYVPNSSICFLMQPEISIPAPLLVTWFQCVFTVAMIR
eukprot:207337-Amorphochlora_amoeboformis.AAC.1